MKLKKPMLMLVLRLGLLVGIVVLAVFLGYVKGTVDAKMVYGFENDANKVVLMEWASRSLLKDAVYLSLSDTTGSGALELIHDTAKQSLVKELKALLEYRESLGPRFAYVEQKAIDQATMILEHVVEKKE